MKDITFTVNDYDKDGDMFEKGIYLHFGDTRIKVADVADELLIVIENIKRIHAEIRDN